MIRESDNFIALSEQAAGDVLTGVGERACDRDFHYGYFQNNRTARPFSLLLLRNLSGNLTM
jgi:hypothetical protein